MVNFAHVGIQKTGSTWLQTGLLKHHPQLQIIGPYERHHPLAPLQQLVGKLYQTPRDAWNREGWLDEFNTYKYLLKPDALVGLSNEQLGGHIFTLENGLWAAERMQDLFGTIKIILVLRHPYTYIHSGYVQSVKSGTCTVVEEEMLQNDAKRASIVNRINYALLIQEYISRFGKENLLVLPFEMLKQDDGTFITYITRFLDIEPWEVSMMRGNTRENRSISAFSLGLLRYANRADQHMGRFFPEKARYLNRTIRWVANRNPLEQRLPKTLDLAPKLLHAYPEFDQLLRDENYVFWDGELSQFNYRFITE